MRRTSLLIIYLLLTLPVIAQVRIGRGSNTTNSDISYGNPKEYEIAEITVSGSEFLDKNALISLSGLKVGDKIKIPGDAISSAIKKLWGQGIIGDVSINVTKIEGEKAFLNIVLRERPRLSRFSFKGVNKTQESDIMEKLKVYKGRVLSDAIIKNTELTIKKHFVDKGYLNTEVKIVQEKDTMLSNNVKLNVTVTRNDKVRINKINIIGNEEISDSRLKKKLKKTHERVKFTLFKDLARTLVYFNPAKALKFISVSDSVSKEEMMEYLNEEVRLNVFQTSKYIRSEYEEDKDKLISFYNSKGYRDAAIISDSIYRNDRNTINLDIRVEEGKKYYFRDIDWTGNYVHADAELDAILGIKKGDVYDMELIQKKLTFNPQGDDISALYMDNGYLFFNPTPVEVKIEGDSIDLEIRIFEGPQTTISKVVIKGNEVTNDHVIRREIRTLPGQKFNRSLLIRTQRELSQLGYFDPEQINPVPIPNQQDGTVDIEYNLVEKSSDQIELSGGWGGYIGFVGTVGLVFNNFSIKNVPHLNRWKPLPRGDGQKLALRVQANGKYYQNYSISFSEPWLGGKKPNSFSVNLNHSVQDLNQSSYSSYYGYNNYADGVERHLNVTGLTVGLGRRVKWPDDYFTVSNSVSYQIYDIQNYDIGLGNGLAHSVTINNTIARNSVDNPLFPRNGSSVSLSVNLTPPYSAFNEELVDLTKSTKFLEYHKWMFDASYYTRLFDNLILNTRAHFGYIGTYNKEVQVGPFERFFMGGSGLGGGSFQIGREIIGLRGYEDNQVVPPSADLNGGPSGGIVYDKFVFELRYPVSLKPAATIYVLGFAEAGNTWANYPDFNPYNVYKSAGFGARIFMPAFGLIGIDWGYGFDRLPGQSAVSGGQFHFTIGQQIR